MIDTKTDLKTWSDSALFDVLKIMLNARPREISVMDARDEAIRMIREELVSRPNALYEFVELQLS